MELLEYHFAKLPGNLYYDKNEDKYEMFSNNGKSVHLNYLTFKELFKQMDGRRDLMILETGIASAGTQSTYLFNEYVRKYGGRFWSVDINNNLVKSHQQNMCPATTLICDDSVNFLQNWANIHKDRKVDVVYLDSYDLDWYDPIPSATHGLKEYKAILPVLRPGSLMLIDDTPSTPYWIDDRGLTYQNMVNFYEMNHYLPGKGQYILSEPKSAQMLLHNYQVLYKFV